MYTGDDDSELPYKTRGRQCLGLAGLTWGLAPSHRRRVRPARKLDMGLYINLIFGAFRSMLQHIFH